MPFYENPTQELPEHDANQERAAAMEYLDQDTAQHIAALLGEENGASQTENLIGKDGFTDAERAILVHEETLREQERQESLLPLEQKESWTKQDLIRWATEQVGKDDAWVDAHFTPDGAGKWRCTQELRLDNSAITTLPPQTTYEKDVYCPGCHSLISIRNITLDGMLVLDNSAITTLTNIVWGKNVDGYSLFARNCSNLTTLEGHTFSGLVSLDNSAITTLANIKWGKSARGHSLFARNCQNLTTLEGHTFPGLVNLRESAITTLTNIVWGKDDGGDSLSVQDCPLTPDTIATLKHYKATHPDCGTITLPDGTTI
jgi:hypothetical protein